MAETTEQYRTRINQLQSSILSEPYMKEMRPDLAEGIGKTGNRQADIEIRQSTIEDDFIAVQTDASNASPSGAEVAVARGDYGTLDERLTAKEQDNAAQLARVKTDFEIEMAQNMLNDEQLRAYVDLLQQQVTSMGDISPEPFGTYAKLKTAYPNGNNKIYVVTADANWYYWNSIANDWLVGGVYQSSGIADGSITNETLADKSVSIDKTRFIKPLFSNYFDYSLAKEEYTLYNFETGVKTGNASFTTLTFENLVVGETYREYYFYDGGSPDSASYTTFFDSNGVFISGSNDTTFIIPAGTKKTKKALINNSDIKPILTNAGSNMGYSFPELVPSVKKIENKTIERKKVDWFDNTTIIHNEYDTKTRITGYYYDIYGVKTISDNYAFGTTPKLYLKQNKTYVKKWFANSTVDGYSFITYFTEDGTEDGTRVAGNGAEGEFTTPSGFDYARLSVHALNNDRAVLYEKDSPYKVNDPRLLLKKENMPDVDKKLQGKTINVLSDSIGSVDYRTPNWWQMIATETGASFNDYAWSGTTLAHTDDRHLWGDSFSKLPTGTEVGGCAVERYTDMDKSADGVIVMTGTNDNYVQKGEWNSLNETDFFGALNVLIKGLINDYAGKPILISTMIQPSSDYANNVPNPAETLLSKASTSTLSRQLRAEAIKLKCNQYGIRCIDLYNQSGVNGADTNKVYYIPGDDLHPSNLGQKAIKTMVQPILIETIV